MRLEVNITKTRFFVLLATILLFAGAVAVYAATTGFSSINKKTLAQAKASGYHTADETVVIAGGNQMTLQDAIDNDLLGSGGNGGLDESQLPVISEKLDGQAIITNAATSGSQERCWVTIKIGGITYLETTTAKHEDTDVDNARCHLEIQSQILPYLTTALTADKTGKIVYGVLLRNYDLDYYTGSAATGLGGLSGWTAGHFDFYVLRER